MAAKKKVYRLMLRVSKKARDKLQSHAVRLSYERDRHVSMTRALDELLLALPDKD